MLIMKIARLIAWSLLTAVFVLSVVPPDLRPETGAPRHLEHFVAYFVTGFCFGLGYRWKPILLAPLLTLFCGLIEVAQRFVPGRHARLSDFVVDALAICIGLLAGPLLSQNLVRT